MVEQVEITTLDIRYESFRLKSRTLERDIFVSISEKGIQTPLQGICIDGTKILLNGFKRYRCALKLKISIVPYVSFASDEPSGIIELLREASQKRLDILEQAKLIDKLKKTHRLTTDDIAELLSKSKAWVSMRTDVIKSMSKYVMEKVFSGDFPAYSYMYTLRKFMRMKLVTGKNVDDFVKIVSGKQHSLRDIEILASAYFKGNDEVKKQIQNKSVSWNLAQLKKMASPLEECTTIENNLLRNLQHCLTVMKKNTLESVDFKTDNNNFRAQASVLTEELLENADSWLKCIRRLHDLCTET